MKLLPLLLLVSVAAFAQQKDKPVKVSDYELDENTLTWDEIFRASGFHSGPTPYSDTTLARKMHEWFQSQQPYVWIDKNRPIIIDDELFQELISSQERHKKMDSLFRLNNEQRKIEQKPKSVQ